MLGGREAFRFISATLPGNATGFTNSTVSARCGGGLGWTDSHEPFKRRQAFRKGLIYPPPPPLPSLPLPRTLFITYSRLSTPS